MKLLAAALLVLSGCGQSAEHKIAPDLYYRADSAAVSSGINAANMSIGETNVRFFGADGFYGRDVDENTFVVTRAPKGYDDTIGRRFKKRPAHLFNWAD